MMRFSKTTEYAIRILVYMANGEQKSPYSATVLHKELDLPYKYITKLMTTLSKHGLVATTRGREGGFSLAKKKADIILKDIISAVETETPKGGECILGFQECSGVNPCCLHKFWLNPKNIIDKMVETTTLKDLQKS